MGYRRSWAARVGGAGSVLGLLLFTLGGPVFAESVERALASLEKQRTVYEREVEKARQAVNEGLDKAERKLRRVGSPEAVDLLDDLVYLRRQLAERDELPASTPTRVTRKVAAARAKLRAAFEDAIAACLENREDDRARELRDELTAFEKSPLRVVETTERCPPAETAGEWWAVGQELRTRSAGGKGKYIRFGDPSWTDYDLEAEVRIDQQGEFSLTFREQGGDSWKLDFCAFNGKHNLDLLAAVKGENRWKHPSRRWKPNAIDLELGRWYPVRVEARGTTVKVFVDGKFLAQSEHEQLVSGRIGAHTFGSVEGRIRRIRVTEPNGALLWRGLPALPGRR